MNARWFIPVLLLLVAPTFSLAQERQTRYPAKPPLALRLAAHRANSDDSDPAPGSQPAPPNDERGPSKGPVELPPPAETTLFEEFSLAEMEQIALENNPTLAQAYAKIQAARGRCLQAGLYPNPSFAYSGQEMGNNGRAGQQGALLTQEIVRGGKLDLAQAAAQQEIRQAEQLWQQQRLRVLTSVRSTYYNALVAQQTVALAGQLAKIGDDSVTAVKTLLSAGEATRVDLLEVQIEAEKARMVLANAHNRNLGTWRQLSALLGLPEMERRPLGGDVTAIPEMLVWDEALGRLLSESPELGAAHAELCRARWALQRARAEPIPNVEIQAGPAYDDSSKNTVAFLQASVIVPLYNRNQGNIRQAEADLMFAQRELSRVDLSLRNRLAETYQRYANAQIQVERYAQGIVPNARESLDLIGRGYRQGEFPFLRLLNAQRTYFETNIAYFRALEEAWGVRMELDGLLLSGGLDRLPGS